MAWLDGWLYRVPIAIDNTTPGATNDVSVPIPGDLDHFWGIIDTAGDELRMTNADGITLLTYQIASATPSWSVANKTGRLEADAVLCDGTDAGVCLIWLYYGNDGASAAAGSFTASGAVDGFIHAAKPGAFVVDAGEVKAGTSKPLRRIQKTIGERIYVWFELRRLLEKRTTASGEKLLWEEVQRVVSAVSDGGGLETTMVEQDKTRFVETSDKFYVGFVIKAGTETDFTIEPIVKTYAPETSIDAGVLVQSAYRILEPRALLTVKDLDEA